MTIQPHPGSDTSTAIEPRQFLFTPGKRLGWTYQDRRTLCAPYSEPPPDPAAIQQQAAARLAAAEQQWQQALRWGLRPTLIVVTALLLLAGCAHSVDPGVSAGPTALTALALAMAVLAGHWRPGLRAGGSHDDELE